MAKPSKESFPRRHTVLRIGKDEGLRVEFADDDGFSADDKEVALSGVDGFVEVEHEGEEKRRRRRADGRPRNAIPGAA